MVRKQGTTSLGRIVRAYRKTAKGNKSTQTDAQLAYQFKKILARAGYIATTSVATHLIAMEVYHAMNPDEDPEEVAKKALLHQQDKERPWNNL